MEYYKNLDLEPIEYFCEFDLEWKIEEWRDVPDYKNSYQVSDLGRIKNLERYVKNKQAYAIKKDRILKQTLGNKGYLTVGLSLNCKSSIKSIHVLVAIAFLNHKQDGFNIIVDHKDNIKTNNNKLNLQLTSVRNNASKDRFRHNKTSQFVGVNWNTRAEKWIAQIRIGKKRKYLGCFNNEVQAHNAYQNELKKL